ncbi:class I SAM-dependent methyltransferase [Cellulomonas cellasea]|uniref:Methyltransferase n=1 Tax=Cellulomonas cellasea TaxID=43670 RepID=A0A4Y3KYG8_9CELL|nr:class I SAM-dependent methyltransferase [Cellulomonas cellasea]GEA87920.1 putative methyltransferase [Cellulomonas cellasea]
MTADAFGRPDPAGAPPAVPALDPRRAGAFGSYAEEYDRWRAHYPDAAVDWLVPPGAVRVADVGAGTGRLTGPLLARGLDVVAVEPAAAMLDVLRRRHPAAEAHVAGAEHLPLGDESVDAVLVATAWHWFRHDAAIAEVRRVLRAGGRLGLVWNGPRPREGWTAALAELDPDGGRTEFRDPVRRAVGVPPDEVETLDVLWDWHVTPDEVRGLLGTHSGIAVLAPAERERVLDSAWAIVEAERRRLGTATVAWPQAAECVRWRPRPGAT